MSAAPSNDSSPAIPHTAQVPSDRTPAAGRLEAGRGRRAHERGEERRVRRVVDERLGVPLDADREVLSIGLDGLDDAVRRPGDGVQPGPHPLHRLVVEGVDVELLAAEQPVQAAGALDADRVRREVSRLRLAMRDRAVDAIGQVLAERPPRDTLSSCIPRQTASTGRPSACAWRRMASSKRSMSGKVGPSSGCGSAP